MIKKLDKKVVKFQVAKSKGLLLLDVSLEIQKSS